MPYLDESKEEFKNIFSYLNFYQTYHGFKN
jgi:hypothetical protein